MAERPIFRPILSGNRLVEEIFLPLEWHGGFAPVQKQRNINALHASASKAGFAPILEISTKSSAEIGRELSAFNLQFNSERYGWLPLESVFQGSKVFEHGGPFEDLYETDARSARSDPRLKMSGNIIGFRFNGEEFATEPKSLFYDWLYLNAIFEHRETINKLVACAAFSDIEFNPVRSINCQARSLALYISLSQRNLIREALSSAKEFATVLSKYQYHPELRSPNRAPVARIGN